MNPEMFFLLSMERRAQARRQEFEHREPMVKINQAERRGLVNLIDRLLHQSRHQQPECC